MLKECLTSKRSSKVSTIVVWLISFSQSRSKEHPKPLQLPEVLGENCPSRTPNRSSCTVSFSETRRSSTYTTRIKITSVFFHLREHMRICPTLVHAELVYRCVTERRRPLSTSLFHPIESALQFYDLCRNHQESSCTLPHQGLYSHMPA